MVSHLCACAHEASTFPSSQTFARIQDNCRCMVSHVCACAHEASTFSSSQTFAGIQDNCTCMVSPLSAVVHGQLPCFLASLRPSLVKRTKKMLTISANLEPTIATVTGYESADPLTVGQGRQACGDCCPPPCFPPPEGPKPSSLCTLPAPSQIPQ